MPGNFLPFTIQYSRGIKRCKFAYMVVLKQVIQWMAWAFMAFFSLYLGLITLQYFSLRTDIGFLLAKQDFVTNTAWMVAFYIHISSSILVVLTGPLQFVKAMRRSYLQFHRTLGKVYVGAILALAAPSGLYMAWYANGGTWSQVGFSILSVLWFAFTFMAYRSVRERNITAHRQWMVRSYALSFSAITLRLYVALLSTYTNFDHDFIVVVTAWINWIPNLIVAELIIRRTVK